MWLSRFRNRHRPIEGKVYTIGKGQSIRLNYNDNETLTLTLLGFQQYQVVRFHNINGKSEAFSKTLTNPTTDNAYTLNFGPAGKFFIRRIEHIGEEQEKADLQYRRR